MANINEIEQWDEGIYQIETEDPVEGGDEGVDNLPHKHLANRTKWLKKQVENLELEDNKLDEKIINIKNNLETEDTRLNTRVTNEVENLKTEDSKLDERLTNAVESISRKISPTTSFCIQNPKSVSLTNTKKTVGFMVHKYKGQSVTDENGDDLTFNPVTDTLPWKGTFWNGGGSDVDVIYYIDDTHTITATVSVKGQTSFCNIGVLLDFTKSNNETGYYHDRSIGDCIIKDDSGNIIESGEIALNTTTGFIADVHIKCLDLDGNHFKYDGLRGAGKKIFTDSNHAEIKESLFGSYGISSFNKSGMDIDSESGELNEEPFTYISYITIYTHIKWGKTNQGKKYIEAFNPITKDSMIIYEGSGAAGHKIPHSLGSNLDLCIFKSLTLSFPYSTWLTQGSFMDSENGESFYLDEVLPPRSEFNRQTYINKGSILIDTDPIYNDAAQTYIFYAKANSQTNKIATYIGNGATNTIYDKYGKVLFILNSSDYSVNASGSKYLYFMNIQDDKIISITLKDLTNKNNWKNWDYIRGSNKYIQLNNLEFERSLSPFSNFNASLIDSYFFRATDDNETNLQTQIQLTNSYLYYPEGKDENGFILNKEVINEAIPNSIFATQKDGFKYIYKKLGLNEYISLDNEPLFTEVYTKQSADDNRIMFDAKTGNWYKSLEGELLVGTNFDDGLIGNWMISIGAIALIENNTLKIDHNGNGPQLLGVYQAIETDIGKKYILEINLVKQTHSTHVSISDELITDLSLGFNKIEFIATKTTSIIRVGTGTSHLAISYIDNISVYKAQATLDVQLENPISFLAKVYVSSNTPQYIDKEYSFPKNIMEDTQIFGDLNVSGKQRVLSEIGDIVIRPVNKISSDLLECDGSSLDKRVYSDLFAVIGYTYGGSGSYFNLPDLRGEFIRGWDHGRGVDASRDIGSFQEDELKEHSHSVYTFTDAARGESYPRVDELNSRGPRPTSSSGGSETRPRNIAMMYCIKY